VGTTEFFLMCKVRSDAMARLIDHPDALALLMLIARRMRTHVDPLKDMGFGEAMIGAESLPLSRKRYRLAQRFLSHCGLATFRVTPGVGTIAALTGNLVFDLSELRKVGPTSGPGKGRPEGQLNGRPEGQLEGRPSVADLSTPAESERAYNSAKGRPEGRPEGQLKGRPFVTKGADLGATNREKIDSRERSTHTPRVRAKLLELLSSEPYASLNVPDCRSAMTIWVQHREDLGNPLTELALTSYLDEARKLGPEATAHKVHVAIRNGKADWFRGSVGRSKNVGSSETQKKQRPADGIDAVEARRVARLTGGAR
jgi:hypothetical protein